MYYIKRPDDLTLLKYKMILKQSEFSYNDEVVSFSINSGVTLTGVNDETGEEFSIPISEF